MKVFIPALIYLSGLLMIIGFLLPQNLIIPVEGADAGDWNKNSYWHYPWGKSVTHKGVDIFAIEGRNVVSATDGFVVFTGKNGRGGNAVLVLGPKWRLHYYAHLQIIKARTYQYLSKGTKIGTVGKTGNAANTPPHLHYSILTPIPHPWRISRGPHGLLKMFYLNPIPYLESD